MLSNPSRSDQATPTIILPGLIWTRLLIRIQFDCVYPPHSLKTGRQNEPADGRHYSVHTIQKSPGSFRPVGFLPLTSGLLEAIRHPSHTKNGSCHTVGFLCYLLEVCQEPDEGHIFFHHATVLKQPCWSYLLLETQPAEETRRIFLALSLRTCAGHGVCSHSSTASGLLEFSSLPRSLGWTTRAFSVGCRWLKWR